LIQIQIDMTNLTFGRASMKSKVRREKRENEKIYIYWRLTTTLPCTHNDYQEENNTTLSMLLWKMVFDSWKAPHSSLKKYECLSFIGSCMSCVNNFYFFNYIYIYQWIELPFNQIDYN